MLRLVRQPFFMLTILFSTSLPAQVTDTGEPDRIDYSGYDREVLVTLAQNQAKVIQGLESEKQVLQKKIESSAKQIEQLTKKLEQAKDEAVASEAKARYYLKFIEDDPEASKRLADAQAESDAENERIQAINDAIAENKLVIGMTLEQARAAMAGIDANASIVEQGNDYVVYRWRRYQDKQIIKSIDGSNRKGSVYTVTRPVLIATYYGEFYNGTLSRIWKE